MTVILIYIVLGLSVGLLAGLFGIGGGILLVPVLYNLFEYLEFPYEHLMHMATSTALGSMVITIAVAVAAHAKQGRIVWRVWRWTLPSVLLTAPLAHVLAQYCSTAQLKSAFGIFLLLVAYQMLPAAQAKTRALPKHNAIFIIMGIVVGFVAGGLGIGGAVVIVPILTMMRFHMSQASATSAACVWPTALVAATTSVITGWSMPLPAYTLGYVYWPALLSIGLVSMISAPWGAKLAKHLPQDKIKIMFSLLVLIMSAEMLFN